MTPCQDSRLQPLMDLMVEKWGDATPPAAAPPAAAPPAAAPPADAPPADAPLADAPPAAAPAPLPAPLPAPPVLDATDSSAVAPSPPAAVAPPAEASADPATLFDQQLEQAHDEYELLDDELSDAGMDGFGERLQSLQASFDTAEDVAGPLLASEPASSSNVVQADLPEAEREKPPPCNPGKETWTDDDGLAREPATKRKPSPMDVSAKFARLQEIKSLASKNS